MWDWIKKNILGIGSSTDTTGTVDQPVVIQPPAEPVATEVSTPKDPALVSSYASMPIQNYDPTAEQGHRWEHSILNDMATRIDQWKNNGGLMTYDQNGQSNGIITLSADQSETLRNTIRSFMATPGEDGSYKETISVQELRMVLATATYSNGSPVLLGGFSDADQIIHSYALEYSRQTEQNRGVQTPGLDSSLGLQLSYINPVVPDGTVVGSDLENTLLTSPLDNATAVTQGQRIIPSPISDATIGDNSYIALTASVVMPLFDVAFAGSQKMDYLSPEQAAEYQNTYNYIEDHFATAHVLHIPTGLYAARAFMSLDAGLHPEANQLSDRISQDDVRKANIEAGMYYARLTGDSEFISQCMDLMEKNGWSLVYENGRFEAKETETQASIQQDKTVAYIETDHNNITSGTTYGKSSQPSQFIG